MRLSSDFLTSAGSKCCGDVNTANLPVQLYPGTTTGPGSPAGFATLKTLQVPSSTSLQQTSATDVHQMCISIVV